MQLVAKKKFSCLFTDIQRMIFGGIISFPYKSEPTRPTKRYLWRKSLSGYEEWKCCLFNPLDAKGEEGGVTNPQLSLAKLQKQTKRKGINHSVGHKSIGEDYRKNSQSLFSTCLQW